MKHKLLLPLLLLAALFCVPCTAFAAEAQTGTWEASDFTYGTLDTSSQDLMLSDSSKGKLQATFYVVTGFSEAGQAKLDAGNTDLVIPSADTEGKQVQGVGASAFSNKGLTSVSFPSGVYTANEMTAWNADLEQRGNFIIGSSAFLGNSLTSVDLPEGTLAVMNNAFSSNKITGVKLPTSLFYLGATCFYNNKINAVLFAGDTDFPLQIANMAFAVNQIKALQIPSNTDFINKWTFLRNTGMEPVTSGNANEKKGGIVYMYVADLSKLGSAVATVSKSTSNVQDTKQAYTAAMFNWNGTTVTGLNEAGIANIAQNTDLVIPATNPEGVAVTAIGNMAFTAGGGGTYTDEQKAEIQKITSVSMPDTITTMGTAAFNSSTSLTSLKLSTGLTTIPASAFLKNDTSAPALTELSIPEGVTSIAASAFAGCKVEKLSLPSTLKTIGNSAFLNHQLTELVLPENVTSLGTSAFSQQRAEAGGSDTFTRTLASITLNDKLESIGNNAFRDSKATSVVIPASVTTLNRGAFLNSAQTVTLLVSTNAQLAGTKAFVIAGTGHVVKGDLSAATITAKSALATGEAVESPQVTVTFDGQTVDSSNYTLSYADNTAVGTGTVTATATDSGKYAGTASGTFFIVDSSDIQQAINDAQDQVADLTGQLDEANAQLTEAQSSLAKAQSNLNSVQSQLDEANGKVADLESQLATATTDKTALQSQLNEANAKVTELTGQLQTANSQLAEAQESLNTAKASVDDLTTRLDTANNTVEDLQDQLDAANASNEDLQGQLNDTKAQLEKANTDAKEAQDNAAALQKQLSQATSDNAALRQALNAATSQNITVKTTAKTYKAKKLKKGKKSFKIGAKAKGTLSCQVTKKSKKLSFKNGKVTVKKGTKAGTYKIKVKITAAAKGSYVKSTRTVTIKVKVKK